MKFHWFQQVHTWIKCIQMRMKCHLAIGCRSDCIIIFQCSFSEVLPFSRWIWPIRRLELFCAGCSSYTVIVMEHSLIWGSGRRKVRTSLNTVISRRFLCAVLWCRSLHWLQMTLALAYRAAYKHNKMCHVTMCKIHEITMNNTFMSLLVVVNNR